MPFRWPAQVRLITSGMGDPRPYGAHEGIDIAPTGADLKAGRTGVFAIAPGRVERVGFMPKGYGNYVVLRHPDGATSLYGHLSHITVKQDQMVGAGALLGRMGATGYATGVHLHLSVRDPQGRLLNPLRLQWGGGVGFAAQKERRPGPGLPDSPPAQSLPPKAWKFLKERLEASFQLWRLFGGGQLLAPEQALREGGEQLGEAVETVAEKTVGSLAEETGRYLTQTFWPAYGPDIVLGLIGLLMVAIGLKAAASLS